MFAVEVNDPYVILSNRFSTETEALNFLDKLVSEKRYSASELRVINIDKI